MKRGKKYKALTKSKLSQPLQIKEAVEKVKKNVYTKFVNTIDLHIKLTKRDKKETQLTKGSVQLPYPFSKELKIIVFTQNPELIQKAKDLKVDAVGSDDLVKKVMDGWLDFDIAIADPAIMPKIAMLGKVLGPKGIMPNPKNNTVTTDIETSVNQYRSGKMDYKIDKDMILHTSIGKVDMETDKIVDNFMAVIKSLSTLSGKSINLTVSTIHLAPTMGPSVKVDKSDL
ncbi:MAG TPA: 50S ribosomal protein L1 [Candidatus Dojkabacteria bacterium]|nr:50S ribosomal protein L1 [Candidatus Dojkabacteria bacterium]HQF36940.1 50S ribosomal protein L1 [Candidatus Dojkabacteria bacterium]